MEVHHRGDEHQLPDGHEHRDHYEQDLDVRRHLSVGGFKLLEFAVLQITERGGHVPALLAGVLLFPQHVLYFVPSDDRPRFADHHQSAVDQYEHVTGYVERLPDVAAGPAGRPRQRPVRALSVVAVHPVESVRPEVPEERGDRQTDGVLGDAGPGAHAEHPAGGGQKRRRPQQRPEPAQLDQVLVDERAAVGEIVPREAHVVAGHGSDQQQQVDEQPPVRGEEQVLATRVQEHGQEHVDHRVRFPDQLRAPGLGPHAQAGGLVVVRLDGPGPNGPPGAHHGGRRRRRRRSIRF